MNPPRPGETVVLKSIPPGLLDGLPEQDQRAIRAIVGKPVLLVDYDEDGRAELEFDDPFDGVPGTQKHTHSIWVLAEFIKTSRQAHLQIQTAPPGVLSPDVTGLSEAIQAVDITVVFEGRSTSHVIVRAVVLPFVLTTSLGTIQRLFPHSVVSLVLTDMPGDTTIECGASDETIAFGAAAAAATLKRAWGWDESAPIAVRIRPAGLSLRIDPVHDGNGGWLVTEVCDES